MDDLNINLDEIPNSPTYEQLPAGDYVVEIEDAKILDTKSMTGKRLSLKYKVKQGDFADRVIFQNLNIINPSDVAQKIAREQLKKLCSAIGKFGNLGSPFELIGYPLKVTYADNKRGDREVRKYESILGATAGKPTVVTKKETVPKLDIDDDEIPF